MTLTQRLSDATEGKIMVHSSAEGGASIPSQLVADFAAKLNNSQYRKEGSRELWAEMKAAGCVAVFGASDDLMELRGAVDDEVGAYNGVTVFLTPEGLFEACDDDCKYSRAAQKNGVGLSAIWCPDDGSSWAYKTAIPHATFRVLEDDDLYCTGIVFALADVAKATDTGVGG